MLHHTFNSEILIQRWRLEPKILTEFSLLSICTIVGVLSLFLILSTILFSGITAELMCIQITIATLVILFVYVLYLLGKWFELFVLVSEQISIISDTLRIDRHRSRCEQRERLRQQAPKEDIEAPREVHKDTTPKPGNTDGYLKLDASNINKLFQRNRW